MLFQKSALAFLLLATTATSFQTPNGDGKKPTHMTFADTLSSSETTVAPTKPPVPATPPTDLETVLETGASDLVQLNKAASSAIDEQQQTNDPKVVAAVAGSAFGVMAGSPLVVGAALGYAGTKILEDEEKREQLGKFGEEVSLKLQDAVNFAKAEIEKEEDPSKIPQKMISLLKEQSQSTIEDIKAAKMSDIVSKVKETVKSDEFKQAPGKIFGAMKDFLESDEVKTASSSAVKAIQTTLESDEVKALQARASKIVQDKLEKKA